MTTDLAFDYQHGHTIGRRDARQARAYALRQAERERQLARTAGPTERAWALGYARGAREAARRP